MTAFRKIIKKIDFNNIFLSSLQHYYQENNVIPYIQERNILVMGWFPLGSHGYTQESLNDPVILKIAQTHHKS